MHVSDGSFVQKIAEIFRRLIGKNQGAALVISLLIILSLALLGLALLLQSNTEHMIAVNERDSTFALYDAESVLQLAKNVLGQATDVSALLRGPDPLTANDNGVMQLRTVQVGASKDSFNSSCATGSLTCESTNSVIEIDDSGKAWEVFRIGIDPDGVAPANESGWEGARGLVYVRIDDNSDEAPATNDPYTDLDKRVTVTIRSLYPIRVAQDGTVIADEAKEMGSAFLRAVGISQRTLRASFGPSSLQPAIVSRTDMEIEGSFDVCGACGSVHADTILTIGADDVDICESATSTDGPPILDDGGTAEIGNSPPTQAPLIPVPVANPYHKDYVPVKEVFDTSTDPELSGTTFLQCPPWDEDDNPGGSKYFALVGKAPDMYVFKAYWNPATSGWEWELIDKLRDGHNTVLDDCGRVVDLDGASFTGTLPDTVPDLNAGTGTSAPVDDGTDNSFYGFDMNGGDDTVPCDSADDDTIIGVTDNDYGAPTTDESVGPFMLPGQNDPDGDGNPDFVSENCMDSLDNLWKINADNVWSPLYNSVIFVYGNLRVNGGPDTLCSSQHPCNDHEPLPGSVWRVGFISLNNINAGGNPAYGPPRSFNYFPDYQLSMVAGRDIDLSGTPGKGDICPDSCSDSPTALAGYAGYIRVHEQIFMHGNVSVNGVIQAEDAAQCSNFVTGAGIQCTGSAQIYYDCEHPPSDLLEGITLTGWEELNQ